MSVLQTYKSTHFQFISIMRIHTYVTFTVICVIYFRQFDVVSSIESGSESIPTEKTETSGTNTDQQTSNTQKNETNDINGSSDHDSLVNETYTDTDDNDDTSTNVNQPPCPEGYYRLKQDCFRLMKSEKKTWYDAKEDCVKEGVDLTSSTVHYEGSLYNFDSNTIGFKELKTIIDETATDETIWIGGKSLKNGKWFWSSSNCLIPKQVLTGVNNSDPGCLSINLSGKSIEPHSELCELKKNFVCLLHANECKDGHALEKGSIQYRTNKDREAMKSAKSKLPVGVILGVAAPTVVVGAAAMAYKFMAVSNYASALTTFSADGDMDLDMEP